MNNQKTQFKCSSFWFPIRILFTSIQRRHIFIKCNLILNIFFFVVPRGNRKLHAHITYLDTHNIIDIQKLKFDKI